MIRSLTFFALALAAISVAQPAFAHHVMGGAVPQTFVQGFLSGLAHPVLGLDHFAALAGIGLLAALLGQGYGLVFLFSAALIGGAGLHLARLTIPAAELYVALATIAIGALVIARGIDARVVAVFIAAGGLIHGYALGESIVGAEQTPLAAYLLGLCAVQVLVGSASLAAARASMRRKQAVLFPAAGGLIALIGAIFAIAS